MERPHRFFPLALLCATPVALCAQAPLAVSTTTTEGQQVVVVKQGKTSIVQSDAGSVPLCWSPDGRWLVLGKADDGWWRLAMFDSESGQPATLKLEGRYSRLSWSPDGRRCVAASPGKGLIAFDLTGSDPKLTLVCPTGATPAWSPNNGRLAFTGNGLWICGDQGENPRAVVPKIKTSAVEWSPDGRTLAYVAQEAGSKKLSIVPASGHRPRPLGPVDADRLAWSPNGTRLLARVGGQWGCYTLATGRFQGLGLDAEPRPEWVDSRTVLGVEKARLVQVDIESGRSSEPALWALPKGKTHGLALCRGIVLDGSVIDPFRSVPLPKKGQLRVRGTVESVELEDDTVTINAWSLTTDDGFELNLAKPVTQYARVVTGSIASLPGGSDRRLEATSFYVDGEVSLMLKGERASPYEVLPIERAWIPELEVEAMVTGTGTARPPRAIEPDGVCMDTVTVPMVFPVLGRVAWSDTFLASRGGGNRRHHGQDLMAPKMRPLVAAFDGTVRLNVSSSGHYTISLTGADGWTVVYMHVNNDTPGTDDGAGGRRFAFAAGLQSGDTVVQGQLLGYCGDSGNAEGTAPHCHFELHDDIGGGVLNATPTLEAATPIDEPVAVDPAPNLKPAVGETRWDGVVVHVDEDRRVLVVDLVSTWSDGRLRACLVPTRAYVRVGAETPVNLRGNGSDARDFQAVKKGHFVTVTGKDPQPGQALAASRLWLGLSMRQ